MTKKTTTGLYAYCFQAETYQKKIPEVKWMNRVRGLSRPRIVMEESMRQSTSICLHPISLRDLPAYAKNRLALPLKDHFNVAELKPYFPLTLDLCKVDGTLLAIPEDVNPYALFTRLDLLKKHGLKPARTMAEFQKHLIYLKKKTGTYPLRFNCGGISSRLGLICSVFGAFGIDLNKNFENWGDDSERMIDAYEWIRNLHLKELVSHFDFFVRQLRNSYKRDEFVSDNFIYSLEWMRATHCSWNKSFNNKIIVSFLPPSPADTRTYHPFTGSGWIIPANTRDPETAVKILKKTQDPKLIKGNEFKRGSPFLAWQDLWDDSEILKRIPFYRWSRMLRNVKDGYILSLTRNMELLDESVRYGIRDNLDGNAWLQTLLVREFSSARKLVAHDVLKKVLEYMEKNLSTIRTVQQIAAHADMSPNYFNQFFQKKMKVGCGTYLKRIRMERAKQLLEQGKLSVKEISRELGFRYPQVFAKVFRKHWGRSPSEMSNQFQNQANIGSSE